MPYVSAAQRGYFHANRAKLEAQGVNVAEWDHASKGKKLPEHVKKADGGAIKSALATARKYAMGGSPKIPAGPSLAGKVSTIPVAKLNTQPSQQVMRGSSIALRHSGMINSTVPGRTDKIPMSVKAGSYVVPADVVSHLGQNNSMAGGAVLQKMFGMDPGGGAPMRPGKGGVTSGAKLNLGPQRMTGLAQAPKTSVPSIPKMSAAGGPAMPGSAEQDPDESDDHVPIITAGGEYVIPAEAVKILGGGDISLGHKLLDKFVMVVKKEHIKTLKGLKPPKK